MKNNIFCLLLILSTQCIIAQLDVKTYYENIVQGYEFYADNNELCPVSIKIKMKLDNLNSSKGNDTIFVIPAEAKRFKLTTLTSIKKGKKYKTSGSTFYNYGDHFDTDYDANFEYYLPYLKGETYKLSQGYNGKTSHQNKSQLDFMMPVGTKIVSVRDGIVIKVIDKNSKRCDEEKCKKYNNLIYIYHNDGTIAEYVHIKQRGAKVKVGQKVKQGQVIAYSGNVGWSTGPHLHFSVFFQRLDGERTFVKTKFKINEGQEIEYLTEKNKYSRNYN